MSNKGQKTDPEKPQKINKWDGTSVKNALDDAVVSVFIKKSNHVECYNLLDGRLCICFVAVLVAMFALLWDWLYPFPTSKPILIICVSSYFILMGVLTLYTTYVERGVFGVMIQKDPAGFLPDNIWKASSFLKKYDDKYTLQLVVTEGKGGAKRTGSFTKSVANFIDENGVVLCDLIDQEVQKLHHNLMSEKKEK